MGAVVPRAKQLYNRATSARQPGSSITADRSYGPALQMSCEYAQDNKKMKFTTVTEVTGETISQLEASSTMHPVKNNGKARPKNWYSAYKGQMTLTCSTAVGKHLGTHKPSADRCRIPASMLKKRRCHKQSMKKGDVNDLNAAAAGAGRYDQLYLPAGNDSTIRHLPERRCL